MLNCIFNFLEHEQEQTVHEIALETEDGQKDMNKDYIYSAINPNVQDTIRYGHTFGFEAFWVLRLNVT